MNFLLSNITGPAGSTVVATLTAPDGITVVSTLMLSAGSPATSFSGSTVLSPTPADNLGTPYTFGVIATDANGTRTLYPAGSVYGWMFQGNWYATQADANEAAATAPPAPGSPAVSPLEKWSVVGPPSATPVTYAQAKLHLRLDNDDEQSLVQTYICAATDYAQDMLAKSLMPQSLRAVFNAEDVELTPPVMDYPWDPLSPLTPLGTPSFATWGTSNRSPCVRLPRGPVSEITSVTDGAGNAIANYVLERTPAGDRLRFDSSSLYPVIVTYSAGYAGAANIPAGIISAILCHVGTLYANRESVKSGSMAIVPHSLEAFYKLKSRRIPAG